MLKFLNTWILAFFFSYQLLRCEKEMHCYPFLLLLLLRCFLGICSAVWFDSIDWMCHGFTHQLYKSWEVFCKQFFYSSPKYDSIPQFFFFLYCWAPCFRFRAHKYQSALHCFSFSSDLIPSLIIKQRCLAPPNISYP